MTMTYEPVWVVGVHLPISLRYFWSFQRLLKHVLNIKFIFDQELTQFKHIKI